jgi:very-short-patch-repair endonuclease
VTGQRGLITRDQLLAAGITRGSIEHRLQTGRLHRHLRGVYLVGRPTLEPLARELAAVLYFDGDAALSHASACWLWGFIGEPSDVAVTLIGRDARSRPGLRVHRVPKIARQDLRIRHGIPLTAPARSLIDFAADASDDALEQAVAEAVAKRLTSARELQAALARVPGRTGTARVRTLLEAEAEPALVESNPERLLLQLIRQAGLPEPLVNKLFHGFKIDMRWPEHRLALEFDGHRFHGSRAAFERDRRRDQVLAAAGYTVIRVTWRQLIEEPYAVIARLAMALQARAA